MEESQEILLKSLSSFGISIPENFSSFNDLTATTLISICCQSLNILRNNGDDENDVSFPDSIGGSVSMANKFKICSDISLAFKKLGYVVDMNYHKFLYPSEEDLYKFVRFLAERLSASSEAVRFSGKRIVGLKQNFEEDHFEKVSESFTQNLDNEEFDQNLQKVEAILKDLRVDELPKSSEFETGDAAIVRDPLRMLDIPQDELFSDSIPEVVESSGASGNEEIADQKGDERVSTSPKETNSKIQYEAENLPSQEKALKEELGANTLQMQHLEEEIGLWKAAADMAFDESQPMDFFLDQLNEQIDTKNHNILELESQWDAFWQPIEEKRRNLEENLYANTPEAQDKVQKLREIELEMLCISSEIRKREEEQLKLAADLKKQPKVASRKSYIERIKEITKNSGKLDSDIERILRETRTLQLESNSIQEGLHRTYAVVDEIVFREAKKDVERQQVYRLLTSIHESFEQISEKILATDRNRREAADLEKKLAGMSSRSLNADKLQVDLDAISNENKYLEQQLRNN